MSGIFGVYYFDGQSAKPEVLQQMSDTIAHRGSDGSDIWYQDNVGLGHRLLWTTPESLLEKQPLADDYGNCVITADARIDNRDELISRLDLKDLNGEKLTDVEIILEAYHKWGEKCPQELLGDFAFVIWDKQKQQLFCARDHFGIKPFCYYHQQNRTFVFASEIKAIVRLPDVPFQLNEVRIGDYLTSTLEDRSITSYQDIWRLPAAHTLTIDRKGKLTLYRYWSLEPGEEIKLNSDQEYAEAFLEIFTEAVRCRLRSAYPIGSHLSGGLDSSSVACVARNLLQEQGKQLHTFSNIFDSVPESNERNYIEQVLAQGDVIPHFVNPDQTGPLSEWQEFFKYSDESLIGNCYLVWGLNRATKEAGVRISLNGFDGDSTVSHGVYYLNELARAGKWSAFLAEGTVLAKNFNESPSKLLRHFGLPSLKELARKGKWVAFWLAVNQISDAVKISHHQLWLNYGLKAIVPDAIKQRVRSFNRPKLSQFNPFPLVNPGFAQRIGLSERIQSFDCSKDPPLTQKEHHWRELTSGLFSIPLEGLDTYAAAFGIESRHPFMDKRLIEFCLALPATQKLNQGWSRIVLRRAMNGILPTKIQWRGDKTDITPGMIKGLLEYDQKILEEAMVIKAEKIADFVDIANLKSIYKNSICKEKTTENVINKIWSSVSLSLWLK